ncbi:pyridoxamine 5'-phosphate oxidase [Chelatococcus sambhunathii]|uniref:Pyridoxine/pyridoxamine 5'-phosphate oxidase n=1 Tax=Chelatococcus sambhunathii TaxID=363953 RepID=A0ABU1DIH1_9HYPH|nr:pyridoxamine 5'-phosphate oxidase [Chelatococcus sambhunathii]MDR4307934.1 pyridoxamine 5'-phosphate oxidase [Chelatococcus sambhunathii]
MPYDFHQADDPFPVFETWLEEATAAEPNDPNAMALATVDASGLPDVRMVLMNGYDRRGFVFYTNLGSAKARELDATPKASLLFHWKSLRRQVRVRGTVERVTPEEADAYYATRPRLSRIGAWASIQSQPLDSRETLERAVAARETEFLGREPPRPSWWSGFRIVPISIEFWQDGAFRLHDRALFERTSEDGSWTRTRLYP